jgi:hypothetical protein
LDVADELQLRVFGFEPRVLSFHCGELRGGRVVGLGLRPALLRRGPGKPALVSLATPLREVRRVETFTTQNRAAFPWMIARRDLLEDSLLELVGERPTRGPWSSLRSVSGEHDWISVMGARELDGSPSTLNFRREAVSLTLAERGMRAVHAPVERSAAFGAVGPSLVGMVRMRGVGRAQQRQNGERDDASSRD